LYRWFSFICNHLFACHTFFAPLFLFFFSIIIISLIYIYEEKKNCYFLKISIFYIELKRVLIVEQEILNDSQSFSLPKKKRRFPIEIFFDWNEINIEDLLQINHINLNELYEQWKKNICKKRSGHQEKSEDSTRLSRDCNCEFNLDMILHHQPIDEIDLNKETCSRLSRLSSTEDHIVSDKLNDCLTTEILTENDQLNSRISLFKLDKSTSTHSLSPILKKQSNIFEDFFTDLFIFEKHT